MSQDKMLALVYEKYGDPAKVLHLKENFPKPKITKENQVLVKIKCTSLNAGDWHVIKADPFPARFAFGLFAPRLPIMGMDAAGIVEAVGSKVTKFKVGDEVYGDLSNDNFGTFAEYALAKESSLTKKPSNLSFEQAAAIPAAAVTALHAIDHCKGQVKPGANILVNGAAGGVGTYAVMIAKAIGATVTAVCGEKNVELVSSIGADRVISYNTTDFAKEKTQYDAIVDCASHHSVWEISPVLKPKGVYVNVGGETLGHIILWGGIYSFFSGKTFTFFLVSPSGKELERLSQWIQDGKLKPVISKIVSLGEAPEAISLLASKHGARGKIVVKVTND